MVTFREFPNEISLCINISGCQNHCPGCHSAYLAENTGTELDENALSVLLYKNKGITCVGFMGGDHEPLSINTLAKFVKTNFPQLRVGWYCGKQELPNEIILSNFDYYKLGPYIAELGPLDNPNTNQIFYSRGRYLNKLDALPNQWYDATYLFQSTS